ATSRCAHAAQKSLQVRPDWRRLAAEKPAIRLERSDVCPGKSQVADFAAVQHARANGSFTC
ncbi:MAG: hypothetical protein AAFU69_13455, partial [Pseudomonadota bacterium]